MNPEKPFLKPKTNKLYLVKQSSENIFYHLDFSEDLHKSMVLILKKREKRRVTSKQRVGEEEGENWCWGLLYYKKVRIWLFFWGFLLILNCDL